MEVTALTWVVALAGLVLILLVGGLQWVAVVKPRSDWTVQNVYGGDPERTDPKAFFAFNQGMAWADAVLWLPLQVAASIGMLLGEPWGFALALMASVPFWYTAVHFFIWDRDLEIRKPTASYWVVTWGMFPVYGVIEAVYAFVRLV